MGVFLKNAELPNPLGGWQQKHVVAKAGRPIRHGEPHAFAGDQPAHDDEQQGA